MPKIITIPNGLKLFILLLMTARLFGGQLAFETTRIEVKAGIQSKKTTAKFKFTNKGETPVRIVETHASCGCTTIEPTQESYNPGEEGEIVAVFDHGSRKGKQHKTIYVTTDEEPQQAYALTLNVDIPVALEVRPVLLFWKADETDTKTAELRITEGFDVKITEIRCMNPAWKSTLEEDDQGKISLIVEPVGSIRGQRGTILMDTEISLPDGSKKAEQHFLYLRSQ